jgi:hypothetical protein
MQLRWKVFSRLAAAILDTTISAYHCLAICLQSDNKLKQLPQTLHSISAPDAVKHCQERLSLEPVRVVRLLPVTPVVIDGDMVPFVESQVLAVIPENGTLQAAKLGRAC